MTIDETFRGYQDTPRDYHGRWTSGGAGGFMGDAHAEAQSGKSKAARDRIAEEIAAAGGDEAARAAVLSSLIDRSDAASHAEFVHNGEYTAAREKMHRKMVTDWMAENRHIQNDGEALMLGGLPGSGKGGVRFGDRSRFAAIDPDAVKQEMLDRGFMPRVPGLTDGEHAALLHEESAHIADLITARAMHEHKNILLDTTMSFDPTHTITSMRAAGYRKISGVYIDVSVKESMESAHLRWKAGGRFIPPAYIAASLTPSGEAKNKQNFRNAAAAFDDWTIVNNKGIAKRKPRGTIRTGTGKATFATMSPHVVVNVCGPAGEKAELVDVHSDRLDLVEAALPSTVTIIAGTLAWPTIRPMLTALDEAGILYDAHDDFSDFVADVQRDFLTAVGTGVFPVAAALVQPVGELSIVASTIDGDTIDVGETDIDGVDVGLADLALMLEDGVTVADVAAVFGIDTDDDRAVMSVCVDGMTFRPADEFAMPSQLHDYWISGPGAAKVGWGTKGSFRRCVSALSDHGIDDPNALCATLYHDATGHWPGEKKAAAALTFEAAVAEAVQELAVQRDWHGRWVGDSQPAAPHALAVARADKVVAGADVKVEPHDAAALVRELGNRPENSDLTAVSIAGYPNLFSNVRSNQHSREDMPQIPSEHLDGFRAALESRGIHTELMDVDPAMLSATQNELNGRKVGGMMSHITTDRFLTADKPIWISSDGRILDGHHRWAAEAVLSVSDRPRRLTVMRVNAPMSKLFPLAKAYAADEDIAAKSIAAALASRVMFGYETVARNSWGRWTDGTETLNGLPGPADLDAMEQVKGPLGSQGGRWYKDDTGQKYLVKPAQSRDHAMNELAASVVYQHAGIPIDKTGVYEKNGRWYIEKQAIQSADGHLGKQVGMRVSPELQAQARDGFAVDALTSTWDVHGLEGDNVIVADGTMYRIDVGGSLAYRAMGGKKDSFAPGQPWTEPMSMRTSHQGRRLYGNMSDSDTAGLLGQLRTFDLAGTDRALRDAGVDRHVRERTIATFEDRIHNQLPDILAKLHSELAVDEPVQMADTMTWAMNDGIIAYYEGVVPERVSATELAAGMHIVDPRTGRPAVVEAKTGAHFTLAVLNEEGRIHTGLLSLGRTWEPGQVRYIADDSTVAVLGDRPIEQTPPPPDFGDHFATWKAALSPGEETALWSAADDTEAMSLRIGTDDPVVEKLAAAIAAAPPLTAEAIMACRLDGELPTAGSTITVARLLRLTSDFSVGDGITATVVLPAGTQAVPCDGGLLLPPGRFHVLDAAPGQVALRRETFDVRRERRMLDGDIVPVEPDGSVTAQED